MFRSLRSLFFIVQVLMLLSPFFGRARRQRLPLLLKEGAFFVLTNWDLIAKYLEKRHWSIQTVKNLLRSKKF